MMIPIIAITITITITIPFKARPSCLDSLDTPTSSPPAPFPASQKESAPMAGSPAAATIPRERLLVLKKVSSFLRRSARLAKMSKPVIAVPCLALLRRSARPSGFDSVGNYRFLREYEFSPSRTPLIHRYCRKKLKLKLKGRRRSFKEDVRSLLVLCSCLGSGGRSSSGWEEEDRFFAAAGTFAAEPASDALDEEEEEEERGGGSIDLRAEMFIRRFYEEMRMQRRLSL